MMRTKGLLIDTSLPYHIPNQEDINAFHKELRTAKLGNKRKF